MTAAVLLAASAPSLLQIGIILLALAAAWILLRFVLKLATRILATGCFVIVLIGLVLLAIRFWR